MGIESRSRPPLPAPTETDSNTEAEAHNSTSTELDSKLTEKSQYTLPEDGSPVTIATRRIKRDGHGLSNNKSQTSLLIEYFEGGKGSQAESRRPSVRVKVTPSSKSRSRTSDHIQITERKGTRKPSYTKRIQLPTHTREERIEGEGDDNSLHSYLSATEESNVTSRGGNPIEVEIMPRRHGSPLIPTGAPSSSRYAQTNQSEISSMPADSFLDGNTRSPERKRSRSLSRLEAAAIGAGAGLAAGAVADKLRTPSRRRSRSLSRERIVAQKAVEKVRGEKSERRRKHRSRSRSVSGEQLEAIKSPRRRPNKSHQEESMLSGADSSLLNSHVSGRSGDAYSFRSGTSKSSINNPKLLETVEDAIRRLILPELTALKREQSKRHDRDRDRRSSITSGSGISRDSRDDNSSTRRSDRGSGTDVSNKPKVVLNDTEVLSGNTIKGRKDKNIDRVRYSDSPKPFERETSEETVIRDGDSPRQKSSRNRGLEAAAVGAGIGALTAAALHSHQSQESLEGERKERRRRRTKSRSRSGSLAGVYEEEKHQAVPPMPLMSDINASEITRSSILSAESERPRSASQELVTPVREISRDAGSPSSRTPTRTPVALQKGLGTQHSNFSQGNLSLHSQPSAQQLHSTEYELDEHGRKVLMPLSPQQSERESYVDQDNDDGRARMLAAGLAGAGVGAGLASLNHHDDHDDHEDPELLEDEEEHQYYQNNQEVPPPLRYVPYAQERRGLSPIQSVSGYTEGEPEHPQRDSRLTHSTGSYSSLNRSPQHQRSHRSIRSLDSLGNVRNNHHDFPEVRTGGLTESELTQDGDYWDEQHRENDRNRDLDAESYRSSDPNAGYKHEGSYTDGSPDRPQLDRVATGQNIKGIGAIPDYVHTPVAVESAVASLVNASELTGASGYTGGQYDRRGSYASFEDGSERHFTSRGDSPSKRDVARDQQYGGSVTSSQQNSPSKYQEEYELDENGRKVAMPGAAYRSSHPAEKAIAASAAAAILAGRNKKSAADEIQYHDRLEDTGAPLHKSFKERAMDQGRMPSPRHSIDAPLSEAASHEQLQMTANGMPDQHNPMPEIGYGDGDSDVTTNPSIIQGPIGGAPETSRDHWPGKPTPPQPNYETAASARDNKSKSSLKAAEAALIGAAVGAGGAAAIAHHNHSREASQDHEEDWQRTSGDRKRDTLITNPYEGTSPIAAIGGGLDRDLLGQGGYQGLNDGFIPTKLDYGNGRPPPSPKDEGYISSAPNNARSPGAMTPEPRTKGVGFLDDDIGGAADALNGGDPFYSPKHTRHLSGMSHGMGSPIYDSATGNGIDRIQSKDIVALMDHLTVRDAQRSARDTEILVTLVRAAAEMRNSFEDMKRLLADTEDVIITEVQTNTDKSVQKINGPRPPPPSAPRSLRQGSHDEMYDDIPNKKRNVFRRALKGLSMKSSNDLGKIEDMLVQLLGEVEGLKVAQGLKASSHPGESYDEFGQEGNYENDRGYEPEGNAGTSTASHASQSGHLSIPQSRGASGARGFDNRKFSDHRISTVPEGDEDELDPHEERVLDNQFENNERLLTPTRDVARGGSAPLGTPPQQYVAPASLSNENTPKTDKSKKHKSSSSSGWIPKVSRWSETTASTVLRGFRSSKGSTGRKDEQYVEPPSRSGSDLGHYAEHDPYSEDKLRRYSQDQLQEYDNETPMSLLPPEDPKYKAHRNSLNLQHPQPRPGPTHRYQTALESQAVNFDSPMSPKSVDWGSTTSLNRLPPQQSNRYSNGTNNTGNMSPVSDGGYSNASASNQGPQRPPKEPLPPQRQEPERPPKIRSNKLTKPSPLSNEHLVNDEDLGYEQGGSPRSAARKLSGSLGVPARKPTGPRSMSSASKSGDLNREDGTVIRRNRNRDTFGTIASNNSGESETF